jgi:hypothetical protein
MLFQILLDCSHLRLVQCQYWNRSRYDVWYWFNRYDSAGRCILFSVGGRSSSPLSVPQLLLKPGSQVFCKRASRSVQVSHSAGTLHLKHASLRRLYEWNIFRSASHRKNREVTHPVGCNCYREKVLWRFISVSSRRLHADMCNTCSVMFIGYSPTFVYLV